MSVVRHVDFTGIAPLAHIFRQLQGGLTDFGHMGYTEALERRLKAIIAKHHDPSSQAPDMTREEALAYLKKYDPHLGGDPNDLKKISSVLDPKFPS